LTSTILGSHDVHVWYRTTGSADVVDARETDLSDLSPDERARYSRFAFARDRCDFAAAHALLRTQLSLYADVAPASWAFNALPDGKPFIDSSSGHVGLTFNLSHTPGLVACAIGRGREVGIDVESVDRALDGRTIATRYFSQVESDWVNACDARERAIRFIELWTLKEAYIKAIGRGLSHPLHTFGFRFERERHIQFNPPPDIEASAWTFALYAPSPRYRMAVAVETTPSTAGSMVARSADGTVTEPIRNS
jgi:4'-phosphopantetheinyl transferase